MDSALNPTLGLLLAAALALAMGLGVFFALRRRPALPPPEGEGSDLAQTPAERGAVERLRAGLARTSAALGFGALFARSTVDEALYEALEDALIGADVGVKTSRALLDELRAAARQQGLQEPARLRGALRDLLRARLRRLDPALRPPPPTGPWVLLIVGVNGSGKTTSIGKLAARFRAQGRKVMLGAGDTFRAGAIEQLRIWSERAQVDIVAHQEGADPAAVLFDTLEAARARGCDLVLCDTAGRLQARKPLMDELGKVTRVLGRGVPGAPHEVLLVLDATMGQNALVQARVFGEVCGVTGVVLTKLDGTAKGGVVIAVAEELGVPVKFIGVGEQVDDLRPFDPDAFIDALLPP